MISKGSKVRFEIPDTVEYPCRPEPNMPIERRVEVSIRTKMGTLVGYSPGGHAIVEDAEGSTYMVYAHSLEQVTVD